jgi:hypothetical protein
MTTMRVLLSSRNKQRITEYLTMKFPIDKTLEAFLEEQVAVYQERLATSEENRNWVFKLNCCTEFNDSGSVDVMPMTKVNEGIEHLFEGQFQFTGSAAKGSEAIRQRIDAMNQMIQYCSALVVVINSLGGWTPFKED